MNTAKPRILGIAIKARRLGFAAIAGEERLLDWGMIHYSKNPSAQLRAAKFRAQSLITRIRPTHVVLLQRTHKADQRMMVVRSLARGVRQAATLNGIAVATLHQGDVRSAFSQYDAQSRHEIASVLARHFPELAWKLPPQRKVWMDEDPRLILFDAVAAAVAFDRLQKS